MSELLTTKQLAEYLQLNPVTVRRKVAKGEIPLIRIGKQLRFDKEQIDGWLVEKGRGKSLDVLVVDDEQIILDLIREVLSLVGCQVTTTLSSLEALETISQNSFDLIFLDLVMPDVDGAELFKRVREKDKDVPVVIVTGYPNTDVMARAMQYGPFVVIKKPFLINDILNVIRIIYKVETINSLHL